MSNELISGAEAGRRLGISRARVSILIQKGRLPAIKVGGTWALEAHAIEKYRRGGPGGRPPGSKVKKQKRIAGRPREWSEADQKEMLDLHEAGISYESIGRFYALSRTQVQNICAKLRKKGLTSS